MKKVLITGKNSYIGIHVRDELLKYPDAYVVEELDVKDSSWKNFDFSKFDVVFHVAGLAHSTPDESQRNHYYRVNTDLAYDVAKTAKLQGVKQFIFMSSIIVYGSGTVGEPRIIDASTELNPDNFYGDSKKQAEIKLNTLRCDHFKIAIVRPPMVYGKNSKGNYPLLSKFAKKTFIFPTIQNQRSMLYLGNLVEFIKCAIDYDCDGVYLPQNNEYVSTVKLVQTISSAVNHKILFVGIFNPFIKFFKNKSVVNKVFGNLIIDRSLSTYDFDYNKYNFEESIRLTEE